MNILKCEVGDKVKLEDGRIGKITYLQWWLGYLNGYEIEINGKSEMIFADEIKQIL